jgi:hypothetical protein
MIDHQLGVWMAARQFTYERQAARAHDIHRNTGFCNGGEYSIETLVVCFE